MPRSVFFSFKYEDVTRAMVVRNSGLTADVRGFIDHADFEKVERSGDRAIQNWIDDQLEGSSVTVVLVGARTNQSRWVRYEIEQSIRRGNGLLGIDISQIRNFKGEVTHLCEPMPKGYAFYRWFQDGGHQNIRAWVEAAAKAAGR